MKPSTDYVEVDTQSLIIENQALKEKVKILIEERQRLINEYMKLKLAYDKKEKKSKSVFFDLISECGGRLE